MKIIPINHSKEIHQKKEVQQEYQFLGSGRKKRGMKLFALDLETKEIRLVKIQEKKAFDISKKQETGVFKAHIKKTELLVWAINKKNALRKFYNFLTN